MKQIALYITIALLSIALAISAYSNIKKSTEIKSIKIIIENQQALIKEMSEMETVSIKIENVFKTNNVLGKTTLSASVENNARQVATILKGELIRDSTILHRK